MRFEPMVSIIIPVYNGSNFMREAIDSALEQTYQNIEVIVINDGSCDEQKTAQIAQSYGNKIRYFEKENGGVSSALNLGIKEMKGDYFSWLSHDDKYYPNKIESEIKALSNLSDKDTVICCGCEFIDKNSDSLSKRDEADYLPCNTVISWKGALHELLKKEPLNGCSLLISKRVFETCGMFDERLRYNQDGFMWAKIFLSKYSLYRISNICVQSRLHSGQLTQNGLDIFRKDCETMSEYLIPEIVKVTTPSDRFLYDYSAYNAKYGNYSIVKKVFEEANSQISFFEKIQLMFVCIYGKIRPIIRKTYYVVFRGMNTA